MSDNQVTRPELQAIEASLVNQIESLQSSLDRVENLIREFLNKSGTHATEIALLKQRMDNIDAENGKMLRWKLIWGGSIAAAAVDFFMRHFK